MTVRIEVSPRPDRQDPASEALTRSLKASLPRLRSARLTTVYLVEGLGRRDAAGLAGALFSDPVTETFRVDPPCPKGLFVEIAKRPGVMDPVAQSALEALKALGKRATAVRIVRRVHLLGPVAPARAEAAALAHLANPTVEQVLLGRRVSRAAAPVPSYRLKVLAVPILGLDDAGLAALSKARRLALTLDEMKAVQDHFRRERREPRDVELLTVAQTWSEHCVHKTFRGAIEVDDGHRIPNLLKGTIFEATRLVRERLRREGRDFCVSVFTDNAGVVAFDERFHLAVKVETHNHPSALEPYGGAGTGLGGVIRDVLGCGLGAWPIANLDVFCFAPPDLPARALPPGVLHPRRVMAGVVAGVRDYGNRMGIPTVNGSVNFHPRYVANPLVFCGTLGLLPADKVEKAARAGDLVVVAGGRTGRDGIGGATFSSDALDAASAVVSSGAVQIGNAITERRLMDAQMRSRDLGLYRAVTDCGAGGLSSAVGEMGAGLGAEIALEKVPLKYGGLSYAEIWLSEAQERMVFAVPPEHAERLAACFAEEGVEATVLGRFTGDGLLRLTYRGTEVGRLPMRFLHEGRPGWRGRAQAPRPPRPRARDAKGPLRPGPDLGEALLALLAHPTVASKEAIVRQYDHEVQGQTVGKPLVGRGGPADAAVLTPVLGSDRGVVLGHGIGFRLGDLDPYQMAAQAVDEALRNVVAVGGDPARTALLDNFCWGSCADPAELGKLVRAAEACRDVAVAFCAPFVSGKDSLNNTYARGGRLRHIPPTLLVTAVSVIRDVAGTVSMDLKRPGNPVYLVGPRTQGMAGSLAAERYPALDDGRVPVHEPELAVRLFAALAGAIARGEAAACHDLSDGGLLAAAAEMALAGGLGLGLDLEGLDGFQEGPTRFLVEVPSGKAQAFERGLKGLPLRRLGQVHSGPRLVARSGAGGRALDLPLEALEAAWKGPLPAALGAVP